MDLITYDFYINDYAGAFISQEDFIALYKRSKELLENITMTDLSLVKKEKSLMEVKYALCAEIEFINMNGGLDFLLDANSKGSFSMGRFSLSVNEPGSIISPIALGHLLRAGLISRRVLCI